jgi:predicted aspartyl protease
MRSVAVSGLAAAAAIVVWTSAVGAATPAGCSVGQMLELKTTMNGVEPMVTIGINGHPEQFMVDSGAFYSDISTGKATELGLHPAALPGFYLKGVGGETSAGVVTVKTVDLAGVPLRNIQFIVGGGEIRRGAGLLGQNVLGIGDTEYDLAHGAVRLMKPHNCHHVNFAYWAADKPVSTVVIEPRSPQHPHTIGEVTINGVRMRAMFDTGANRSTMTLAAAARLGLKTNSPDVHVAGYSTGIGRRTVTDYLIPIDSIKLGDQEEVRRTHILASAMELDADLLIGADFFLSHRVYVANAEHKLFFTYGGGPIFSTQAGRVVDTAGAAVAMAADTTAEPTDAAGFSRRGAAFMARRDYPRALADFDKAVALAPGEARFLFQRAEAHERNRQPLLAMDDLDQTLTLAPDNAEARLARASVRLGRHDRAAAQEDVATVDKNAAPAADARLTLAAMYGALDQFDRAIGQYDLWLRYHPEDPRRPVAFNGRCWARAELGTDLGKALSDCDAAIKARPNAASYLDSRGLVRLRMGDNEKAVRDYDASLALAPKSAWSLYGRGLAKQHLGQRADGQKDIDAAVAIDAHLPERAKKLGVS